MAVEQPAFAFVVARMSDAKVNLSAFSSLVFPVCLLIEAPIIMLLAASTKLCRDWDSYVKVHRFMTASGIALTLLHAAIAFTPIYDFVATDLIGAPLSVHEPARVGLQILTFWTWAIAYRRFQQGVLIGFHDSRAVAIGTALRLGTNFAVLAVGYASGLLSGIAVGTLAIAAGVFAEAIYAGIRVRPLHPRLQAARPEGAPLTRKTFLAFYIPLAVTPLMALVSHPIGAGAMNRMPQALASTAAWTPVYSLAFLFRTPGFAFNEVVVALAGRPGADRVLRAAAYRMAMTMTVGFAVLALTPLGRLWFADVLQLDAELVELSTGALAFAMLLPGIAVLMNWRQGFLVHDRRTAAVTEAVAVYLIVAAVLLAIGVYQLSFPGIYVAICAFTAAGLAQTAWLGLRGRVR